MWYQRRSFLPRFSWHRWYFSEKLSWECQFSTIYLFAFLRYPWFFWKNFLTALFLARESSMSKDCLEIRKQADRQWSYWEMISQLLVVFMPMHFNKGSSLYYFVCLWWPDLVLMHELSLCPHHSLLVADFSRWIPLSSTHKIESNMTRIIHSNALTDKEREQSVSDQIYSKNVVCSIGWR